MAFVNANGLSDEDLLAESPQNEAPENETKSNKLQKQIREKPPIIVYVPVSVSEELNEVLCGGGDKENVYDARNYKLAEKDNNVNQFWTWVMCALMLGVIALLWRNGCQIRTANRYGFNVAKSGMRAAKPENMVRQ